ncbi:MAG: LuxR family transcriptional regulator, partial [Chloroflexota bacterium]|nr:LuxR family transcriptional regulator [Chloroflexota bacterium]
VLVLDDYHLITAPPIHEALIFLLDHLPPTLHLVIATRADPPLPLPRLRARGQLTELRQADLRFTGEEAIAFLNEAMGLSLSAEDVAVLGARTEGWIAGLQVAAVSMQGHEDTSAFIRAFTGSDRYILDYLVEEVLQRQPEDVQTFLLQTSILNRLSGPLCDAMLEIGDWRSKISAQEQSPISNRQSPSQQVLEQLEAANLFIVPLDNERKWFRYHRLFADLLRARQEQRFASQDLATLHRRAANWYEEAGLLDDAVQHAIAANDLTHMARIIETHGRPMLLRGELRPLLRWINLLPEEMMQSNARLCITHAWALLLTGQGPAVEPLLRQIERLLTVTSDDNLRGESAVIRAYLAAQRGDVARTIEQADLALALLDAAREGERAVAYFVLGGVHILRGDVTAAGEAMAQASTIGQRGGNVHVAVPALNALAEIQAQQGQLHLAWATAQEAVHLASDPSGKPLPIAGGAISALAELAYEWNDLENALTHARQSIELNQRWGNADPLGSSYLTLARVLQAFGDLEGARDALQAAERASRDFALGSPFPMQLRSAQARQWLAHRDWVGLMRWAEKVPHENPDSLRAEEVLTLAQVRLALGQPDVAQQVLTPLLVMARERGLTSVLIEGLALQAMIHHAQGDVNRALVALAEPLALAESEGYVRHFVDLGAAMAELLRQAAAQGITPDYVSKLLSAYGE